MQMVLGGFGLNLIGIALVVLLTYALVIPVFDVFAEPSSELLQVHHY